MKNYSASGNNVKHLGRAYFDGKTLWCAHSGTGAALSFSGRRLEITVTGDIAPECNRPRIAAFINGERVIDDVIDAPEKTYEILKSETSVNAEITVTKLTESAMSVFGISRIAADSDGKITPLEPKDALIEFIGDSITCAFGVDAEGKTDDFAVWDEDITKCYAYKTAEAFDADYSMVSFSGWGVISGYTADGGINAAETVPPVYDKIGYSNLSFGGKEVSSIKWDFKRKPDIAVLNLGTNDRSYCLDFTEKRAEFENGYRDFLKKIREFNPEAHIICALGMMGDELFVNVRNAAEAYSAETGDQNISILHFDDQKAENGYAANLHPSVKSHSIAAETLIQKIKDIKGLK